LSTPTLISSQASEDSPWLLNGQDGQPSDSARSIPTPAKYSSNTGPASQTTETSETSKASRPTWLQGDFLASHTVLPGSEEARAMTARSGRKCSELLPKQHPLGSLLKTCLESSTWNSNVCFLTWKPSVTPVGRLLFQLAPWTQDTDEAESGLWPTPSANDWKGWSHGHNRADTDDRLDYKIERQAAELLSPPPTQWPAEPALGRVAHGIPNRSHRLKGLGNAIVPQVAAQILHWMKNHS
jgi:hypothetical protein